MTRHRRHVWGLLAAVALGVAALVGTPFIGGEALFGPDLLDPTTVAHAIFWEQRVPRALLGALVGGSLALAGAGLQAVLRNPLAEPYTLGLSGGAAVGAALALLVPGVAGGILGVGAVPVFALVGAFAALAFVFAVARRPAGVQTATVLLAGVTVSILAGGVILIVRILVRPDEIAHVDRWMMGGLAVVGYTDVLAALPILVPGALLVMSTMRELNHLSVGEDLAAAQGVAVAAVQRRVLLGGGLLTAAAVAAAGPIGFVGLLVPHALRLVAGRDHRVLLPGAFFLGGAVLMVSDAVARAVVYPTEIPVGAITAVIGGPLFIALLLRSSR